MYTKKKTAFAHTLVLDVQTLALGNSAEYSTCAGVKQNDFSNNSKVTENVFLKVETKSFEF